MERLVWLHAPPLVFCEKTGQWATWWRGIRPSTGTPPATVIETRSLAACREELNGQPAAFVVLELTAANLSAVLDLLADQERLWPRAAIVVVADRSLGDWEPIVREAGALAWSTSPRRLRPLVEMACRHTALHARPYETIHAAIDASLPWRSNSTD
ncbi:MAG: hypothetical protein JNM18_21505 [Planctomycetaceae bacterium]|nr:hypothetical protein [Planctomycetaceae bacterium]